MMAVANREVVSLVLVEELSHRVLNEYTQAIAGLSLAARRTRDAGARRQLIDAAQRLHAHADAHRVLAMPGEDACDVADYIAQVCATVAKALGTRTSLRLQLGSADAVLPGHRCWQLALIVSELLHNAARHGAAQGEIAVELSTVGATLVCQVRNAAAPQSAPDLGRGRRVVAQLAEALGGRADWFFTPAGVCALVIVPLDGSAGERPA